MLNSLRNKAYQALRQSESFFKTDMVYLTKSNFWLFSGQMTSVLASLVLAVAFANMVTPEVYGNYKYVLSIAGIISAFSLSGLATAVLRAVSRGYEGTLPYAFRLSLIWSIGMALISAALSAYYFIHDNQFLGLSLIIIGVTSPLISAGSLYRSFFSGKGDFRKLAYYSIAQSSIPTLSVLCALLLQAPLVALVSIYFGSTMVIVWFLYLRTRRFVQNWDIDPLTNKLGKHLSLMGVISTISGRLDSVLVFQLLGGAELAVFSLAVTLPDMIRGYFKNITSLAIPKFALKTKKEMKEAVWSKIKTVTFATSFIALIYMIATPYLFQTFFPKYLVAIPYSQVYALSIVTSLLLATAYFDSQSAVKERYILNMVINGTTILTTVAGIYFFGLWGAILARIVTRIINVSLSAFLIARH